jgi:hypothetical protein
VVNTQGYSEVGFARRLSSGFIQKECAMLIKDRTPVDGAVETLKDLISTNLSTQKKFRVERELKQLNLRENGGQNPTNFINFYCADSRKWAIIHDLRIQINGVAAHIDHILINRFFDVYLLESSNYSYSLKITADGEFLVFDGRQYQSVDSPLEENKKRIQVVEEILHENKKIIPKRLGLPIRPKIESYVLVSSASKVVRPPKWIYDTTAVISADYLTKTLLKEFSKAKRFLERIMRLPKAFNADTVAKAAGEIAALHQPNPIDYRRWLTREQPAVAPTFAPSRLKSSHHRNCAI